MSDRNSLENRPGIFVVGSPNVGKRTLLSRLISVDFEDAPDSSSQPLVHGWTINTKYYTADVSVWMAHLQDGFSVGSLPVFDQLTALVMVFDMSEQSTLVALQDWVSQIDLHKFEILLCIGNKVDLIPGHPVHAEYKRRLLKLSDSSDGSYSGFAEYGIFETEGSSLLGDEEPSCEIRRSCLEWCCEHNIEFIEACASSTDFDKCLSVDGDCQGVERLFGALSAHMWPGMILKTGDKITEPSLPEKEELSEEESEYEFDYEVLSGGSAEPWDDTEERWVSAKGTSNPLPDTGPSAVQNNYVRECEQENATSCTKEELQDPTFTSKLEDEVIEGVVPNAQGPDKASESDELAPYDFEDLEQLMSEIGNIRDNLRLMPDFQRREMAAKMALKMAAMFGGGSDDEDGFE
ncbi:hypothetical protein SLEP1_g39065 [Rubroshorea leprosula]|uniref:Uncharacterized protein n=1 Tax=Rubroshorea leprosula TaxID=152421 RepID=A0AAV5KZF9_9ROSI|nr:hypothetical protein SLEP1_g39065 [Rubroshorea leprosula]